MTTLSSIIESVSKRVDVKTLALCFLLALIQGALFAGTQWIVNGIISFPLDDTFIHLQYGKQIARGAYFQYQDGAPVTSGATSFLYAHLLAIGYAVGLHGGLFKLWVHFIALGSVTGIFYLLVQLGRQMGSALAGRLAVAMTFLSGSLAWAFWSGMEIALFAFLMLLLF